VEDDIETPKRSKRHMTTNSFRGDFIMYPMDDTAGSISEVYASRDTYYSKEVVCGEMHSIVANGT
jgi:hypothetical protein